MKKIFLATILIIAFLLRFVAIANFPAGFNADEASNGYDAYSILLTGRDQWGHFMPLVLKSFGDYKSPLYVYLTVPSVAAFGLNVFATRLPNVLIGTLAVLVTYLLVSKIVNWKLGIVASILLACNPWAIMASRGAFEFNLITLFVPLGIYFFLKEKYSLSSLVFGLSLFTYHSAKLITPLVFIGLLIIFRDKIKKFIPAIVIFLILFSGLLYTFKIGGGSRIAERSITQGALLEAFQERTAAISRGDNPKFAKILHNKYSVIATHFVNNYFQYFSPKFLIQSGAGDATYGMIPGIGMVNMAEFALFFGVIPLLFFDKKSKNMIFIILLWLLVAPLTGALASGTGFSGNRAEGMIPALQILAAFGFLGWFLLIKKFKKIPIKIVGIIFIVFFVFGVFNFVNLYFRTQSDLVLKQMLYGNVDIAFWISKNASGQKVLVSRGLSEPQIFLAFVDKWDPSAYQNNSKNWNVETWLDQVPSYNFRNYTFKSIDWKSDVLQNGLIVAKANEAAGIQIPVKIFSFPDGLPNVNIYEKTN